MDTKEQLIALMQSNFPDCRFDIFMPIDGGIIRVKMYDLYPCGDESGFITAIETGDWDKIIPIFTKEYAAYRKTFKPSISQAFEPLPFDKVTHG